MSGFELIETRYVSGKGIIQMPFDKKSHRAMKLYVDVIRPPKNIFKSLTWNPPRSFYANFTFTAADYVYKEQSIHFEHECLTFVPDYPGQTLFALKCALDDIFQSFINLENALGLVHLGVTNRIEDFTALSIGFDTIKVACYADTALALRLYRLEYDACDPSDIDEEPPGEPPPPLPPVPPGTPLNEDNYPVSPPYTEDDTVPFPGDELEEDLPFGDECVIYNLTWVADYLGSSPETSLIAYSQTLQVYGVIESIDIVPSPQGFNGVSQISITSGGILAIGQPCIASTATIVTNLDTTRGIENLEIVSMEPA